MTSDSDARTGRHDGPGPEGLRRLLDELPLPELERTLRGLLADRLREADLRGAFEASLNLTEVLVRTGRFRAAFAANEQTRDLAGRAPVGPWSRHAAEVQHLRLLHELGHDEEALPWIAELLLELLPDPASAVGEAAHRVDSGVDEVVGGDEVLEVLVDVGRSTVVALGRWRDALYFSDLHLNLLDARRAAPVEIATAQLSRSAALREVGELDAADTVLLYCQEVFTDADDGPGLTRVLGGRGQVSWARGDREAAVALQLAALGRAYRRPDRHTVATAHRHLAAYLPESAAAQRLAHGLAAAVVHRLTDDEAELDATVGDIVARAPGDDLLDAVSVGWLVAEVDRVEGVDFVALTAEFGLDADGVATVLAELVPILRGRSAGSRSAARALRRWEPAIATLVAAVNGDDQARRALDEYLALQEQSPEYTRLVAALRAMADGVRDPGRLVTGLDDSDARIVGHASDALAGRIRLLATPTDLPAALYDARRRHRELVRTIAAAAHGRPAALAEVWRWLDAGAGLPGFEPLFAAVRTVVLNGLASSLRASAGSRADRRAARRAARRIDVRALTANLTGPQAALVRAVVDEIRLAPSPPPGAAETVALRVRAALDRELGLGPDELRGALEHGVAVDDVLRRVCQAVDRWVGEGSVEVAVSLLNEVVSQLLGRGDPASALAPAERLVELAVAGPPGRGRRQPRWCRRAGNRWPSSRS